jgi:hypothetical protein
LTATQFAADFKVDVMAIMEHFGVSNKARMLAKINLIYQCAKDNQERLSG